MKARNLALGLVLMLLFLAATRWMLQIAPAPSVGAERAAERLEAWRGLQAENARRLNSYAVADKARTRFQIPIERAMERVLPELNAQPPRPAGPVATPAAP